jgi:hypothetical protein
MGHISLAFSHSRLDRAGNRRQSTADSVWALQKSLSVARVELVIRHSLGQARCHACRLRDRRTPSAVTGAHASLFIIIDSVILRVACHTAVPGTWRDRKLG